MLRLQSLLLLCLLGGLVSCSTTAKGPVSKNEYKVQVGGWQDMDEYKHLRKHAVEQSDREEEGPADCNVVDCPEIIRRDGTE